MSEDYTIETAIKDFLQNLAVAHSPATVKTYRVALNRFSYYLLAAKNCNPNELAVANLNPDWAVDFLRALATGQRDFNAATTDKPQNQKTTRATQVTYAAALIRFYNWCSIERRLELSADEYMRLTARLKELRGKNTRTIINKVPDDEIVEALLKQVRIEKVMTSTDKELSEYDKIRHKLLRLRNIALLETLKSSGARVSELCNLRASDLDNVNRRARVVGKGGKERWIYFSPTAWQALQDYLTERTKAATRLAEQPKKVARRARASQLEAEPVFCRHDRGAGSKTLKPMASRTVENTLWQLVEEADLQTYITPHKFRHWFATQVLATTGDLAATQDLLGHASPATTRIYAQVSEQRKQAAHQQVFKV